MKRYHLQIDDGASVSIDEEGQDFPNDDFAIASAAEMAGRLLSESSGAMRDPTIEVRVETDEHQRLGTVTASLRRTPAR